LNDAINIVSHHQINGITVNYIKLIKTLFDAER
jgi:hypothetical protein